MMSKLAWRLTPGTSIFKHADIQTAHPKILERKWSRVYFCPTPVVRWVRIIRFKRRDVVITVLDRTSYSSYLPIGWKYGCQETTRYLCNQITPEKRSIDRTFSSYWPIEHLEKKRSENEKSACLTYISCINRNATFSFIIFWNITGLFALHTWWKLPNNRASRVEGTQTLVGFFTTSARSV